MKCDNKAIINISENPVQHNRTKHVEVDHTLSKKIENDIIELPFVTSRQVLAKVLTKLSIGDPTTHLEGDY